ncbi:MAG: universal stress protein [Bacteroidia bacterium]|nr:universal stress protein [Bacteroidia bacterium]MDW8158472.1 universal stress protein [Bacteroidia bacterium]
MNAILVPVDFSSYSANALVYGLQIAAKTGWKCYALRVTKLKFTKFIHSVEDIAKKEKEALEEAQQELRNFCQGIYEKYPFLKTVPAEQLVRVGLVVEEILSIVEEFAFQMIIMGTQGAESTEKKIFGSNTALVIENTTVPVLAIPANCDLFTVANIVFALDIHKKPSDRAIRFLCEFAQAFDAWISILYIQKKKEEPNLDELAGEALGWFSYPKTRLEVVVDTSILHGIELFVAQNQLDILALVARDHATIERIFGSSLVREIALHFHYPFLALH